MPGRGLRGPRGALARGRSSGAGTFHETWIDHSPLDIVAWHGNYCAYKYDLRTYSPVGAILFDHPDPSIFTVLTAPSGQEGTANIDFVLFRERWMVAEHSFRPPWYHKNIMSELMGNIYGVYDAKPQGFAPGGMCLHNCMLPHGPDRDAFEGASNGELKPEKLDETMSFMFETRFPQHLTEFAAKRGADAEGLSRGLDRHREEVRRHPGGEVARLAPRARASRGPAWLSAARAVSVCRHPEPGPSMRPWPAIS